MKRPVKLLILAAAVALLLIAYLAFTTLSRPEENPQTDEIRELFSAGEVTSIAFDSEAGRIELNKKGDFWYWSEDEAFPLDQDIPKNMTAILNPLYSLRLVSEAPEDPSLYGFDGKECAVTVTDSAGSHRFAIGDSCSGREGCYIRVGDSPAVYLGEISVGIAFLHGDIYDLIQMDPYPKISPDRMIGVTLRAPEGTLTLVKGESAWTLEKDGNQIAADEAAVGELLKRIAGIRFEACVDYRLSDKKAEEIFPEGLGFTVEYEHVVRDEEGNEKVSVQRFSLNLEIPSEGDFAYAKLEDSPQLCLVEKSIPRELFALREEDLTS